MAKDARQLREDAAAAASAGKHKRALECYLELERMEPTDAQWPKRVAETYRRLGKLRDAVSAFERAADRYAQNGFLVQAIAVCKLILQIDPAHVDTQQRLAAINAAQGAGPTRIGTLSDNHPSLHENPAVALLRARRGTGEEGRSRPPSSNPPVVSFVDSPPQRPPSTPPYGYPLPSSTAPPGSLYPPGPTAPPGGYPPPIPPSTASPSGSYPQTSDAALSLDEDDADINALANELNQSLYGHGGHGGHGPAPHGRPAAPHPPPSGYPDPVAPSRTRTQSGGFGRPASPPVPYPRAVTPLPFGAVPQPARAESQSQPIVIERGMALESVTLGSVMPGSHQQRDDGSQPGILIIPLEQPEDSAAIDIEIEEESQRALLSDPAIELDHADLEADDAGSSSDIPLAAPRLVGAAARQALAATPLFARLNERQLEALISRIDLMTLAPGQVLFREGEHGDSLIVIAEGEVIVEAMGPPPVEPTVLSAGAFFGEVTLITDHPRMTTVTAKTMVEALRIDRDALAFVVARHPEVVTALLRFVRDRLVERWMRTSPLCRPFTERQRREFASRFRFLEIEAGSVVMAPGDTADGLYIVLAGQFMVSRDNSIAARLGPGELIGETVLMTGEPLQSAVVAQTKCLALWLPVEHFQEVITIHPHVREYVGAQAERRRLQIY